MHYIKGFKLTNIFKMGWLTTDNASNNFTMMKRLEDLSSKAHPNVRFDSDNHIR